MPLKRSIVQIASIAVLALSANVASATPITGEWTGSWAGAGATATFSMTIGPLDSLGRFSGSFDWTCTSGFVCSGIENFSGGIGLGDSFAFWTTSFVNPVNLASSVYWGNIIDTGNTLVGWDSNPGDSWIAHRVTSVPEPGAATMMALGLIALGFAIRKQRKLPAAKIIRQR